MDGYYLTVGVISTLILASSPILIKTSIDYIKFSKKNNT